MNAPIQPHRFILEPFEAHRFANLCGQFDEHLRLIEQRLAIEIRNRGNQFELIGEPKTTSAAEQLLRRLYREAKASELSPETVHLYLQESTVETLDNPAVNEVSVSLRTRKGNIRPRGVNQQRYVKEILANDINFGIGPAGTGKTYLAVACAVDAWSANRCAASCWYARLSRPARSSASCLATWRRKSTRTCARCTTPSTRCSASNTWPS